MPPRASHHAYSPQTRDATRVLGLQIAIARRARRWTESELAGRAGVSRATLRGVEQGAPTVAIGTVFEIATLVGVQLFGADAESLSAIAERERDRLALLPRRVRETSEPVSDDF
jgi:transcriptional regulator with XRE-family HTH domain